jgi:hypothetical protein
MRPLFLNYDSTCGSLQHKTKAQENKKNDKEMTDSIKNVKQFGTNSKT